jgi:hypothetical protein
LKPGEKCLINAVDVPTSMTEALIGAVYQAGAYPLVNVWSERIERAMAVGATKQSLSVWADADVYRMKMMDAFIGIRGIANVRELSSIPEQAELVSTWYNQPVHMKVRVPHTRWVVLRYPTECFAMQAACPRWSSRITSTVSVWMWITRDATDDGGSQAVSGYGGSGTDRGEGDGSELQRQRDACDPLRRAVQLPDGRAIQLFRSRRASTDASRTIVTVRIRVIASMTCH